jgi:hypothetical protein
MHIYRRGQYKNRGYQASIEAPQNFNQYFKLLLFSVWKNGPDDASCLFFLY